MTHPSGRPDCGEGDEMGEYVLDLGRKAAVPCPCGQVSLYCASLIPQDWLRSTKHLPATRCRCGRHYYSWSHRKTFVADTPGRQAGRTADAGTSPEPPTTAWDSGDLSTQENLAGSCQWREGGCT